MKRTAPYIRKIRTFERDRIDLVDTYPNGVTRDAIRDYYNCSQNEVKFFMENVLTIENGWIKDKVDKESFYRLAILPTNKYYAQPIDKGCAKIIKILCDGAERVSRPIDERQIKRCYGEVTGEIIVKLHESFRASFYPSWNACIKKGYVKADEFNVFEDDSIIGYKYQVLRTDDTINPYLYS